MMQKQPGRWAQRMPQDMRSLCRYFLLFQAWQPDKVLRVHTWESCSLAMIASTATMQAACAPVAPHWGGMHYIMSKPQCSLGDDSCASTHCAEEKGAKAQSRSWVKEDAHAQRKLLLRRYDLLMHHGLSQTLMSCPEDCLSLHIVVWECCSGAGRFSLLNPIW